MRAPFVLLASVTGVVALAAVVVLPARREVAELREEIRSAETDRDSAMELRAVEAADRLEEAVLLTRLNPDLLSAALGGEPAPREIRIEDDRSASFPLPWNRLPAFLARLAEGPFPSFESVKAAATEDPAECKVTLLFAPLPSGFTPR